MKTITTRRVAVLVLVLNLVGAGAVLGKDMGGTQHEKTCKGDVIGVNQKAGTVSVKTFWGHKTFNAAADCKVSLENQQHASLGALHPGQMVEVRYEDAHGVLIADQIVQHDLTLDGYVAAIDPKERTLRVRGGLFRHDFNVAKDCAVMVSGDRLGSLADLKLGQTVTVTYERGKGPLLAEKIEQKSPTFDGTVQAVDADARTVKVKGVLSEKTFHLADGCKIVANGKMMERLNELRIGGRVAVTYEDEHGVLVASRVGLNEAATKTANNTPPSVASNPMP